VEFRPAEPDTGIVFVRRDLNPPARIKAVVANRIETPRRTTLTAQGGSVEMVEHIMAALAGLQIDNCELWVNEAEMPGCDGSSRAFVEALDRAGIVEQDRMRNALVVEESISVRDGDAVLAAHPPGSSSRLMLSYHLDYGRGADPAKVSAWACPPVVPHRAGSRRTFPGEEAHAAAPQASASDHRTDLLIFGREVLSATSCGAESARHKISTWSAPGLLGVDLRVRRGLSVGTSDQRRLGATAPGMAERCRRRGAGPDQPGMTPVARPSPPS
jgi:hypothetical protein